MIQPFAGDPIPPLVKVAFSKQAPGGTQAVSWNAATVSVDPQSDLIYAMDALPGEIAAVHLGSSGLRTAWKVAQTTTEFIAIIGPPNQRVIVGSDIPGAEIPDLNMQDEVVWRNAATGQEIARSAPLPAMTSGTMVQPDYCADMFYPSAAGSLYKLEAGCRRRKIEARMRPLIDAVSTSRTARSVGGASVVAPAPVSDDRQVGDLLAIQGALALMNAKLSRFPAAQFRRFHNLAR